MESVGPYTILERLGAGALGELYRARDTQLGRTVALRVVDPALAGDSITRESLLADARAARRVTHPHVAALLEIVDETQSLCLVHELVAGPSLASEVAGGPLPIRRAVTLAAQAAEAISAASAAGVVHGALDPRNILVAGGDQLKILDLGLSRWTTTGKARKTAARALESEAGEDPELARSARYVSPEQALGAAGDARADVFALGVILYELLTGRVPFDADSPAATVLKIVQAQATPASQGNPAVPVEADRIVQRALAKSLDARYPDAAEMAKDLRRLAGTMSGTVAAVREPPASGTHAAVRVAAARRARWGLGRLAVAAGVIVLVAALAAVAWFGRNRLGLPWADSQPSARRPVVMVVPFGVSGDTTETQSYFGPGFAEDVASRLSEIPGTTVVGRASIREPNYASDWRARARALGAVFVVRGAVRPGQYALHADVELLDVDSGGPIWAQHFAREPRQVSGLETEIASQIAQKLKLVTPTSNRWARASVRQIDPAAYDLYLQGRDAAGRRDRTRAIGLYDQALEREPRLVEARASLAQALYLEEYYAGSSRAPAAAGRALREAEASLAVDAELPAAHLAAALSAPTTTTAASALSRALAYDPSNGEAWHHAGDLVSELDPPRSIAFYRASLALEPAIDANWRDLASTYAAMGNVQEAEKAVAKGEAARPDRPWWRQVRARLEIDQGRQDAAVQLLSADPSVESTPIVWLMGRVVPLALGGRMGDARREANRLAERYPAFCEGRAMLAAVEIDGGAADRGRQLAAAILAEAARPDAEPALRVCAALAAAGTGDSAETAGWLSKVASDERALRLWTRQATFGVGLSFRSRWYPWNKVAGSQPMQVASAQLDQSMQRLRDEVERRLPAPPGSEGRER